jgi:DNA-binding XRE family transcriptional regulator
MTDNRFNGLDRHVLRGAVSPNIHDHHRYEKQDSVVLRGAADAGLFLRAIRERKGLTRQFVAELMSMSKDTVKRLERGRPCTTMQTVIDGCTVLGCEVEIRVKASA